MKRQAGPDPQKKQRPQGPTGLGQVGQNLVNPQQRVAFDPNYMAGFNAGGPSGPQGPPAGQRQMAQPQATPRQPMGQQGGSPGLSQMGAQVSNFLNNPQMGPDIAWGRQDYGGGGPMQSDFHPMFRGGAMQSPWGGGGFEPFQGRMAQGLSSQFMMPRGGDFQMMANEMGQGMRGGMGGYGGLERTYGGMMQGMGGGMGGFGGYGGPSPQIQQAIQQMQQQRALMMQQQMQQQMGQFGGGYGGGYSPMAGGAGNTWASLFGGG